MRTTRRFHVAGGDSGAAMIFVLLWAVVLVGLSIVVTQVAVRQIQPSDRSEHSYAALSAAEAGIEDYIVRLRSPGYELLAHPDNPALSGYVRVPGGTSDASYTYAVDASKAQSTGEIRVYSTGRSGSITRTVEAVLSKRSPLDYVYLSDIETPSPEVPGAYSTAAASGGNATTTGQQLAANLCSRHWYESGRVDPTTTVGTQRNLNYCQWAGIYSSEKILGRIHTNDIWRLQATNLSNSIDADAISSSCRSTAEGLTGTEVGCPATHRYLTTNESSLYTNTINNATWTSNTAYQGNAFRPSSTSDVTLRNPRYEPILQLPTLSQTAAQLKAQASTGGCVFTGPTRIRFDVVGGQGVAYITSPDTKVTGPSCGGTYMDTTSPHTTNVLYLKDFEDLIIYVQDAPTAGVDDPNNAYDVNNVWTPGSEPTCKAKVTTPSPAGNKYPFVVPTDSGETGFNNVSTPKGFPSYLASITSPWYGDSCTKGDAYVQGSVLGRVTIATENNIILTSTLKDSTASTVTGASYGKPATSSQSVIGLVSNKFTYLYRPLTSTNNWVGDWKEANGTDPILNVAVLAVDACFGAQDPGYGNREGNIYLWGSLSQKYRCVVGSTGGYNKVYKYDERLGWLAPPFIISLFQEPWESHRTGELNELEQTVGTKTWPISLATGETLTGAQVVFGNASATASGSAITVTARAAGQVIVRYTVTSGGFIQTRRLVIVVS